MRLDYVQWLQECFASLVKVLRKNADLLEEKKRHTSCERYQGAKSKE